MKTPKTSRCRYTPEWADGEISLLKMAAKRCGKTGTIFRMTHPSIIKGISKRPVEIMNKYKKMLHDREMFRPTNNAEFYATVRQLEQDAYFLSDGTAEELKYIPRDPMINNCSVCQRLYIVDLNNPPMCPGCIYERVIKDQ